MTKLMVISWNMTKNFPGKQGKWEWHNFQFECTVIAEHMNNKSEEHGSLTLKDIYVYYQYKKAEAEKRAFFT